VKKQAVSLFFILILAVGFLPIQSSLAIDYWDNAVNLWPNTTTKWDEVREIMNTANWQELDVKITYHSCTNITVLEKYYLTANGTTFVAIDSGIVTTNEATVRLSPSQKLLFNIEAKPTNAVTVGQTESVVVAITRTEIPYIGPEPPPETPLPILKITGFMGTTAFSWIPFIDNYYIVTLNITNTYAENKWTTIKYWLTDQNQTTVWNNTLSLSIPASSLKITSLTYPLTQDGAYTAHATMILPTIGDTYNQAFTTTSQLPFIIALLAVFLIFVIGMAIVASRRHKPKREEIE